MFTKKNKMQWKKNFEKNYKNHYYDMTIMTTIVMNLLLIHHSQNKNIKRKNDYHTNKDALLFCDKIYK